MARKKNDKPLSRKVAELESIFGGQKRAAEKLGVSTRTLANYKSGKAPRNKDIETKINRIYGANKKKFNEAEFEKRQQEREKKQGAREKQIEKKRRQGKLVPVGEWVKREYKGHEFVIESVLSESPTLYVAVTDGGYAEFVHPDQLATQEFGISKQKRRVKAYGLFVVQFFSNGEWVNIGAEEATTDRTEFKVINLPITLVKDRDLQESFDYVEHQFMLQGKEPKGRVRLKPYKLIGFEQ